METNGRDHAGRGEGIHPEVFYLQPAHTCTHITGRIGTLCGKAATIHTFSIHTLHSTDGSVVVHLAVDTISGSCRAIGFRSVSLQITHGGKKKSRKFRRISKVSRLTEGLLTEANGYKKSKFHCPSLATMPLASDLGALPQGCNNTLLHLSLLYDPATLHLTPLKPMLTVIENTQDCHSSLLSSYAMLCAT